MVSSDVVRSLLPAQMASSDQLTRTTYTLTLKGSGELTKPLLVQAAQDLLQGLGLVEAVNLLCRVDDANKEWVYQHAQPQTPEGGDPD